MNERTTMSGKPVFTVPAKSVINFQSKFGAKLLCDGMTFTAGDSCTMSCSFCFVEAMQKKRVKWFEDHGVTGDHFDHVIRRENAVEIARKQIMSKPKSFRQKKQVIYGSPLVDVCGNQELMRETVEICKVILELTNWDIRLLSKSNLLPKVAKALEEWDSKQPMNETHATGCRVIYGVSTGTLDDELAAAFEQGTAKVSKRIESLHWLQDNGFRTFGMICPSLPQDDYVDFAWSMSKALRDEKCEHVWAEVINLRGESFTRTEKALLDAGFRRKATQLSDVSHGGSDWENYARDTFRSLSVPFAGKLRFLQYVTKDTRAWWEAQKQNGAIPL